MYCFLLTLTTLIVASVLVMEGQGQMTGGISSSKPADPEVVEMAEKLKENFEKQANAKFEEFVAVSYSSQVVAGTNYFIKVRVAPGQYVHVRVFKPLPYTEKPAEAKAIQTGKTEDDPINYF